MNNHRLLGGFVAITLLSLSGGGTQAQPRVISLDEIFRVAETNALRLRPSFTSEAEAEREISVAKSRRLPDIKASLSLSYIGDGFTTRRNYSDYRKAPIPHLGTGLGINVEQPVYTGGAITNAIRLAELKSTASRYSTELQRDNLRFRLAGYYLDLYRYNNLRSVVEANIARAKKVLDEMHARYEQGIALHNDITRYELLLSNLELQLVRINNTTDILNHQLVATAGLPEGTVVVPDSMLLARSLPSEGEQWWQKEADTNSPSLMLSRKGYEISRKSESLVKADRLPKIGLQAGWTLDGPILVEVPPLNRNLSYWWVGIGVSYDISSLYKNNKSLARSRTATIRAREEYEAAKEDTELSVRADYIRYMEAYEELKTAEKSLELAEVNYNTAATRYSAGMALITDMLDAANSRLDAEQKTVNSQINIIYYYYKLLFISGTI